MEANESRDDEDEKPLKAIEGKRVIAGVMTHERLLAMVEERNPIIARRQRRPR